MRRNEVIRDFMIGRKDKRRGGDRRMDYAKSGRGRSRDYRDYRGDYREDYRGDYRGDMHYPEPYYDERYDYSSMQQEYETELKDWINKLKHKDKFKMSESDIIHKAKAMGVKFQDYDEIEFIATFYMLLSDFGAVSNDPHTYLVMAKAFLEDDDIAVSPSEKLCIYFYKIVEGE